MSINDIPYDERINVPEDLPAVDLHDSYQFGEHIRTGDNYVLCRYEGTDHLIYWGDEV